MLGYAAVLAVGLAVLVTLGIPSVARVLGMAVLWGVLIAVPYGFRSAVLDWRGERVTATVVEVRHGPPAYSGNEEHRCKVEARGDTFWLRSTGGCDWSSRPGDRYEVLHDPGDLVGATGPGQPIGMPAFVSGVAGVLVLLAVLGARSLRRKSS
ncbi:hypothetical protein G3I33_08530 [Streptomyces sp. SID9124]|nr:hypothetical protein [Streptomyces sp. SID9124]NED11536.1 hypothetical protein [Streptomyces sp. SID9124]